MNPAGRIAETGVCAPGMAWNLVFSKETFASLFCAGCHEAIKPKDEVYYCEVCKELRHVEHTKLEDFRAFCQHSKQEYTHWRAIVLEEAMQE